MKVGFTFRKNENYYLCAVVFIFCFYGRTEFE